MSNFWFTIIYFYIPLFILFYVILFIRKKINEHNIGYYAPNISKFQSIFDDVESLHKQSNLFQLRLDYLFRNFYQLKKDFEDEYNRINWTDNQNKSIMQHYQRLFDGYYNAMRKEVKLIRKTLNQSIKSYVDRKIDSINDNDIDECNCNNVIS